MNNSVPALRGRSFPERPGQQDCPFYMRTGQCAYAMTCRFNHPPYSKASLATAIEYGDFPQRPGQPDCQYYVQTGSCRFGATCKFNHPRDKVGSASRPQLNALLLPLRPGEMDCGYYMRTGTCGFGPACKFNHPQPQAVLTPRLLPWQQQQQQVQQRPFIPSTNQPLLLSIPTLNSNQLPKASSSAASSSSSYSAEVALLPERPDQMECQYYMRTGQCKFGVACRFHHPRDRNTASSSPSCPVSPMGLPLRPGTRACVFYLKYGQCKFGATCRFDHPYMAVPYSSPISAPHVTAFPVSSQFRNPSELPPPLQQQQQSGATDHQTGNNDNDNSNSNGNSNSNNSEIAKKSTEVVGFPPNGIQNSGLSALRSSSSCSSAASA